MPPKRASREEVIEWAEWYYGAADRSLEDTALHFYRTTQTIRNNFVKYGIPRKTATAKKKHPHRIDTPPPKTDSPAGVRNVHFGDMRGHRRRGRL